jgi:hypothetical protein
MLFLGDDMLKQDDYVKGKLVEMGWRFCRSYVGAGHIAGEMIMQTLSNRVRNGWGSWLQVIDRVPVFMAENELPPLEHPSIWEPTFIKLLQTVDGVFDGSIPDKSKGAQYWGDLSKIERSWFLEKIVQATKLDQNQCLVPAHNRVANTNGLCFWQ